MPFPFFAPLSPWIVDVMEEREANPVNSIYRSPFIVLTSGALVVKGSTDLGSSDENARKEEIKSILNNTNKGTQYKGCIISNNINNLELSYSIGQTIVGVDFTGQHIKVEGEAGRRVSTPIIESVDIDTDGANNTLKTAKVNVRCFTLKQLEMFEMFFMKPGMNVMIEWGDTALLNTGIKMEKINDPVTRKKTYNTYQNGTQIDFTTYTSPIEALVPKNGTYDGFCDDFSKYYRSDTSASAQYMNRVERSLGSYDLVAGKVLDYSFSVEADGTYMANFEVSQGNQISLALPHSKRNDTSKEKAPPTEVTGYTQIIEQIIVDFNLDPGKFKDLIKRIPPENGREWEDDLFNFIKINKEQKDTVASSTAYISLRFILRILLNYVLETGAGMGPDDFFKLEKQEWLTEGDEKIDCIPVTSNVYMMAGTDEVIFPRQDLPKLYAPAISKDEKGNAVEPKGEKNEVSMLADKVVDTRIGTKAKYDFHMKQKLKNPMASTTPNEAYINDVNDANPNERLGNALNIFVKYETVVKHWQKTYTRIDFLEKVLDTVNNNSYGLFRLVYGLQEERGKPTIIDYKLAPNNIVIQNIDRTYRFKPTTIKSIVRQFSFNFEMSNLVAGRTIFNSGKFLTDLKESNKGKQMDAGTIELPASVYKAVDNSTFGNADGWYSINNVELKKIEANLKKAVEMENNKTGVEAADTKPEEATKEIKDFTEVIKNKSINFLIDEDEKSNRMVTMIYQDKEFIQNQITKTEKTAKKNKPVTSPLTVTLTIDGFSGFRCGQYFNLDGIPEIYNMVGVFQITNTKHNIAKDGWTTTIEADFRVVSKESKK